MGSVGATRAQVQSFTTTTPVYAAADLSGAPLGSIQANTPYNVSYITRDGSFTITLDGYVVDTEVTQEPAYDDLSDCGIYDVAISNDPASSETLATFAEETCVYA